MPSHYLVHCIASTKSRMRSECDLAHRDLPKFTGTQPDISHSHTDNWKARRPCCGADASPQGQGHADADVNLISSSFVNTYIVVPQKVVLYQPPASRVFQRQVPWGHFCGLPRQVDTMDITIHQHLLGRAAPPLDEAHVPLLSSVQRCQRRTPHNAARSQTISSSGLTLRHRIGLLIHTLPLQTSESAS